MKILNYLWWSTTSGRSCTGELHIFLKEAKRKWCIPKCFQVIHLQCQIQWILSYTTKLVHDKPKEPRAPHLCGNCGTQSPTPVWELWNPEPHTCVGTVEPRAPHLCGNCGTQSPTLVWELGNPESHTCVGTMEPRAPQLCGKPNT